MSQKDGQKCTMKDYGKDPGSLINRIRLGKNKRIFKYLEKSSGLCFRPGKEPQSHRRLWSPEPACYLVYHAAALKDKGNVRFSKESAMAKLYAAEVGNFVTYAAIQILGAEGYGDNYPVERMYRDVKLCEIGEGTSEIQRLVISRMILKEVGQE